MSARNFSSSMSSYGIILLSGTDFTNNTFFEDYEKPILNDLLKKALEQAFIRDDFPDCESAVILQFIRRYVKVLVVQNRFSYAFVEFLHNRRKHYNPMSRDRYNKPVPKGCYEQMTSQEIEFLRNPTANRQFLNYSYWEDDDMTWFKVNAHFLPNISLNDFSKLSVQFPKGKQDDNETPTYTICRELHEKTRDGNIASVFGNPNEPEILPFRFITQPNGDLEWRQSTTEYDKTQFALAIYDSTAESKTTYIRRNTETRSYSWISLEDVSRIMEKDCNYSQIIDIIAHQLADAFTWYFMQLDRSDRFIIMVKLLDL